MLEDGKCYGGKKIEQGKGDPDSWGKVCNLECAGQSRLRWEVSFGQRPKGGKSELWESKWLKETDWWASLSTV